MKAYYIKTDRTGAFTDKQYSKLMLILCLRRGDRYGVCDGKTWHYYEYKGLLRRSVLYSVANV